MGIKTNVDSGGGRTKFTSQLYSALEYSGLVTSGMTHEEMCEALFEKYPPYYDYLKDGVVGDRTGGTSYSGITHASSTLGTNWVCSSNVTSGWDNTQGYYSIQLNDISQAKSLTVTGYSSASSMLPYLQYRIANSNGSVLWTGSTNCVGIPTQPKTVTIDLSGLTLTDSIFLQLYQAQMPSGTGAQSTYITYIRANF